MQMCSLTHTDPSSNDQISLISSCLIFSMCKCSGQVLTVRGSTWPNPYGPFFKFLKLGLLKLGYFSFIFDIVRLLYKN